MNCTQKIQKRSWYVDNFHWILECQIHFYYENNIEVESASGEDICWIEK